MWPFRDRKRYRRYRVDWTGSLHCCFERYEETLEVKIRDVSPMGVCLIHEKLQVGPFHMLADNPVMRLLIQRPEGQISALVCIRWYNSEEEGEKLFTVGLEFSDIDSASRSTLDRAIKGLQEGS